MKIHALLGLAITLLIGTPTPAQETPAAFEITEGSVAELVAEIRGALEKELGEGQATCPVRLATHAEIEKILFEEQLVLMRNQFEEEELARSQARIVTDTVSRALLAKFALATQEILVVPENFEFTVHVLDRPELASRECLRAVLLHEMVHAADQHQHDMVGVLQSLKSGEAVQAYSAVMEGHAQHVTRRICAQRGWTEGFEVFTRSIGELPEVQGESEAMEMMRKLQVDAISTAYYEGERFVAAIEEAGGAEAVTRAFKESPRDLQEIFHPEWYLDPSTRPTSTYDLERGLDQVGAYCSKEEWVSQRLSITPNQLELALALLPRDVVKRVTLGLRHTRLVSCGHKDGSGAMVILGLYEFTSPAEARFYVDSALRLNKIKDEQSTIEFHAIRYEDVEGPGPAGFVVQKETVFQGQDLSVSNVVLASSALCVELLAANASITSAELLKLARSALEVASTPSKRPGDGEEQGQGDD